MSPIQADLVNDFDSRVPSSHNNGLGQGFNPSEIFKQVYALSLASNTANEYKGTQDALQTRLQKELPGILATIRGQWNVAWGPAVWKSLPDVSFTGPDNVWFVAHSPSVIFDDGSTHETYVVAIAGTNSSSLDDWFSEDFGVNDVVDFSAWVKSGITQPPASVRNVSPNGTYVADGTATAIHTLLTEPSKLDAGLTLYNFLSGIPSSSSMRLVFTGHSLGGALSPTMALALVRSGALKGEVLVYPTAGPSPGNRGFADIFSQTFPASPTMTSDVEYAVWNTNIVNSLDVVPQAWCTESKKSPAQNMDNIPPIYGIPAIDLIKLCVFFMGARADSSRTLYIPLQSTIIDGGRPTPTDEDVSKFVKEAMANHLTFYDNLFSVIQRPKFVLGIDDELVEKTKEEKVLGYPIIGDIQWGNEHRAEVEKAVAALPASGHAPGDE